MAAKLKACQEIMPPPNQHQHQHQPRRISIKHTPYRSAVLQNSSSPSIKSLNGSLNASKIGIDQDDALTTDTVHRSTTAI